MNITNEYASPDEKLWVANCGRYVAAVATALGNPQFRDIIGTGAELIYMRALWLICQVDAPRNEQVADRWRVSHYMLNDTLRQVADSNGAIAKLVQTGLFTEDLVREGFLVSAPNLPVPASWRA